MILSSLLLFTALASSSSGFIPLGLSQQHVKPPQASARSAAAVSNNNNAPSDDMIRKDIEAMREEARQRLRHLNHELEDFINSHDQHHEEDFLHKAAAYENAEVPLHSKTSNVVVDQSHEVPISVQNIPKQSTSSAGSGTTTTSSHVAVPTPPHYFVDGRLLHDTRWKVVIQVGTKSQTERYQEKPLLLHLVVDFTSDKLKESDDLLQGSANAKTLVVQEAWIGAGSHTEGHQRDIRLKPTGGWKILPGQGPKGIDILRFYFDVEEEICHSRSSNLRCPARRVYCTAGIFSMEHHNESELFKDHLRKELDGLVQKYEDLTLQEENDERAFSLLDRVKRAKQMMELKAQIRDMNQKIIQAKIRDPEKSILRLSRRGDVGVTKDGQVCYRETNGLSSEYLVLGKMEMASVHKPVIEPLKSSSPSEANHESEQLRP